MYNYYCMMFDILTIAFLTIIILSIKKNDSSLSKKSFDNLKGLSSLVVLIHHISQDYLEETFIFKYFKYIGGYAVSIFLFVTGYGLMKKYVINKDEKDIYISSRIKKVGIPFLIANIAYYLFFMFIGGDVSFHKQYSNLMKGWPLVTNSYYVFLIIEFYIFFYILLLILKNKKLFVILEFGFLLINVYFMKRLGFGDWWYVTSFCICVGQILALYENEVIGFINKNRFIVTTFCLLLFVYFSVGFL